MGVKHLWDLLDSCKKTLPLHSLQNKRVCIDLSCWMVQLHNVNKSHCSLKSKVYLQGLFHRLRALLALNCSIIFISDGSIPAIKLSTYRRRLNSGVEVPQHQPNSEKATSLRRNLGSEFSIMIKETKLLGLALGIPCLDGIEEAEAQCALLNLESLCDGCFTSDSDVFLFGARTVYRDICLGEGGHVVSYEMADIESQLGFGRNSLISLALLLGGDYSPGVHGMGPESACQIVKSIGDTFILQQMISEGLSFAKKKKCSKKHGQPQKCNHKNSLDQYINMDAGNSHNPQRDNEIQQVINAYLKPKCHSADSTTVHSVLAQHPFQRAKLQQLCLQFFQWPPEKTDEYILPKIAERDLRRLANLRSTSSELGVKLPLHKIPVKCPVSGIIKRRKAQGRECFEVLWDDLDGLTSSIVPAHLIESACPEKIVEFEKKAQEKKQNNNKQRRSKKPENKASLAEIELRLQNLLLDIESGTNAAQNATFPSTVSSPENSSCTSKVDQTDQYSTLHDTDKESDSDCNATQLWHQTSMCSTKEVIDLLSPSPAVNNNKAVSRRPRATCQGIEVISLSDSESDMSPEHERKAGERRSFLASIKDGNL